MNDAHYLDPIAVDAAAQPLPKPAASRCWRRRFLRHRLAMAGSAILTLLVIASLAAPLVEIAMGIRVDDMNLMERLAPPSLQHPLGTDELGRDLLLRLLYGGQVSLLVGLSGAILAAAIGTVIGLLSGYIGGRLDALLMRATDCFIALPLLPLLIVFAAIDLEKLGLPEAVLASEWSSLYRIIAIVALFGWTTVARLVRCTTASLRAQPFIMSARAAGASRWRIMRVHVLPNVISPIVIAMTLSVGNIILLESVLSFLSLGIQPPLPSWGNMLNGAQEMIWEAPNVAIFPGLLIFITVMAFNFVGDGLQDALDPKACQRKMGGF